MRRALLTRAARGAYVVNGSPASLDQDLTVGLFALGSEAWVSHEAACTLHRLDRALPAPSPEFTTLRNRRNRSCPFALHTTISMPQLDRVSVNGFRCTSGTRTILDLAHARIPPPVGVVERFVTDFGRRERIS